MFRTTVTAILFATLLIAGSGCALTRPPAPVQQERELELLAILAADAQLKEKADACRELTRIGTSRSVPALAALLGDDQLAHTARYALEPMRGAAVDKAFRTALGELQGLRLIGVIGSVGARRDRKAVKPLTAALHNTSPAVMQAAAHALGSIGTPKAATALESVLAGASETVRPAVIEGLFRCAEQLADGKHVDHATAIYDLLRADTDAPHQIRAGALRGAVLTRGSAGVPLLLEAIRGNELAIVHAAARTAMELPGPEAGEALAGELGELTSAKQIVLALTLSCRGDRAALPALLNLAKEGETAARVAAMRALPELGDAAAAPVLATLRADDDADVAEAAQNALAALAGPEVDAMILNMLEDPDAETRAAVIDLLGQRRMSNAVPALLKTAGDANEDIRLASIKALGALAGAAEFTTLIDLLLKATASAEVRALENALTGVCTREARTGRETIVIRKAVYGDLPDGQSKDVTAKVAALVKEGTLAIDASNSNFGDPAQGTVKMLHLEYTANGTVTAKTVRENETVTVAGGLVPSTLVNVLRAALPRAKPQPKLALLRVLRSARGPAALDAVRAATADPDSDVRNGAISLLCSWPSVDVLPELTRLVKSTTDQRTKILALRGCFRLIPMQEAPARRKVAAIKDMLALAQRSDEKKLALSALGDIPTVGALDLVTPCLTDPKLKEEAGLAAAAIGKTLVKSHPSQVANAMEQALKTITNKRTIKRAQQLLKQAKAAAATR